MTSKQVKVLRYCMYVVLGAIIIFGFCLMLFAIVAPQDTYFVILETFITKRFGMFSLGGLWFVIGFVMLLGAHEELKEWELKLSQRR